MQKFKDLTQSEKRFLLLECLVDDGADKSVAYDTAYTDTDTDRTLRDVFGYTDDTEVEI